MMNQNTNNGNRNTALETALAGIIAECKNIVKLSELENLSSETITTCNLSELLAQKKQEVADLEATIAEAEEAKAKQEAAEKAEAEKDAKFISSLTNSEREALAYLEGLQTLAGGENENLIKNIMKVYRRYTTSTELSITANIAAYVAILIKEEKREVINLLETITIKTWDIQKASKKERPDVRLNGLVRILMAVQELY